MQADPARLSPSRLYRLMTGIILPRPIAWVSTVSPRGIANLAPFSFFNGVSASPPAVVFSPVNRRDGSKKDTVVNIEATGEFVVNVVPFRLVGAMNETSAELDYEISEFDRAGLTRQPSRIVQAPGVKESPVHLECVLHRLVRVGEGPLAANVVIGRIVWLEIDDSVLTGGWPDPVKMDPVGRLGGDGYVRAREIFFLPRPKRE